MRYVFIKLACNQEKENNMELVSAVGSLNAEVFQSSRKWIIIVRHRLGWLDSEEACTRLVRGSKSLSEETWAQKLSLATLLILMLT